MPMASVELEQGEVLARSNYPRYPDQKSVEDAARKTSSSSPGKWAQYVRSFNEKDETKLQDQLTNCPSDSLRNALYKALGDRIDTINMEELMKEIEELVVVRQSNNVNTLAMITTKQERDEPVRQFAARLRGLAAVCDLSGTCSCGNKVSEVEKWVGCRSSGG